jgi:ligand-binding sensor domain-containing protein/serine phosphatase RsbU (regulator of sigma subunit)
MLLNPLILKSQDFYFSQYSVMEGLAQSKVYDIVQDKRGYVWLGTESGVSRFDGQHFTNYTPTDGLATGSCRTLFLDNQQRLWIGHTAGAISFIEEGEVQQHPLSDYLKSDVTDIFQDSKGNIWITTLGDGMYILQEQSLFSADTASINHLKGSALSDRVFSGLETRQGEIYLITDVGVKQYQTNGDIVNYLPEGLTTYWQITCMLVDSQGDKWFGTHNGGLYRRHHADGSFTVYDSRDGLAHNFVSTLIEDEDGAIWAGTWGGGITRFTDSSTTTFHKGNGLQDERIHALYEDREGNILIGTNDNGLVLFKGDAWVAYGKTDGLQDNQVWAIHEDHRKNFWFATNDGLFVFDPYNERATRTVKHYNQQSNAIGNQIRFLAVDYNENLWIGTLDNGLLEFDMEAERFIFDPLINQYFQTNNFINALAADDDGNLWIGTLDGLLKYELETRQIKAYSQLHGLLGNEITCLQPGKGKELYIGIADKGVNILQNKEITQLKCKELISPTCFALNKQGQLWVGTRAKGVFQMQADSLVEAFNQRSGLLSDYISQLIFSPEGNLFVGTNRGVNRIDNKGRVTTYTERRGFVGIEAKPNASFLDSHNNLWFGTVNGAMLYRPLRDFEKTRELLTHITEVRVNSLPRDFGQEHKFNFLEDLFEFHYQSVCLRNPDAVSYQIKLEGADPDWRAVGDQTQVTYSSLSPGKYEFRVRAKNSEGVWNEQPQTYSFVINPPFWRQAWFIIALIIAGLLSLFAYIKIRERNLVRDKYILEQKVAERTAEVVQKSEEIALKNKDITDSIKYAQRIQYAILPPGLNGQSIFVFFRPKDIVSGDFYWYEEAGNIELFAAVDCTGHGVPGAFLSILGANLLTKIVKEYGLLEPADILNKLNEEIGKALHQKQQSSNNVVNDGMDLALVAYDSKAKIIRFSGAYNPLYLIRQGQLLEYKANRFSIGRDPSNLTRTFTQHELEVVEGDMLYLFSDGYADQFGGPDNKKLMKKAFKELLITISSKSMDEQKKQLAAYIEEWMSGGYEQIDDMVVLGRRIL